MKSQQMLATEFTDCNGDRMKRVLTCDWIRVLRACFDFDSQALPVFFSNSCCHLVIDPSTPIFSSQSISRIETPPEPAGLAHGLPFGLGYVRVLPVTTATHSDSRRVNAAIVTIWTCHLDGLNPIKSSVCSAFRKCSML